MGDELFAMMLSKVNILALEEKAVVLIPKRVINLLLPDHPVIVRSVHYLASGERIPSSSPRISPHHHDPVHPVIINLDPSQYRMHTLNS
jgi:hypothetical protein